MIAYDRGTPSLSSTAKLWVTVADTPDSVPDFAKAVYTVEVAENAKPGDIVYKLDAGEGPFKYFLLSMQISLSASLTRMLWLFFDIFQIRMKSIRFRSTKAPGR